MKLPARALISLLIFLFPGPGVAETSLEEYEDVEGRSFHARLYRGEKQCVACHGSNEPSALPADDVCLECHELEELVTSTARPEDELWQNPHNNLHWGKDVPCMECHSEHQESKPLCEGCHSFKYPDYKR